MNATTTTEQQPASAEAQRKAGFAAPSGSLSRQELETYLRWALEQRRIDLVTYSGQNMYDFLKGRQEECKVICEHFGIK